MPTRIRGDTASLPLAAPGRVPDPSLINFSWLIKLRWASIVAQAATVVLVTQVTHLDLPLARILLIFGLEIGSNVACAWGARAARRVAGWALASIMALDILLLTALFQVTGGPANPFSVLYLVPITLAAVVLPPRWTWGLVVLSFAGFGALFLFPAAQPTVAHATGHGGHFDTHLRGMWVAFGCAECIIVFFVQRVTTALAARDAEVARARSLTARNEKLASLATLAAGSAHELSTPLATIAVVARELERQLDEERAGKKVIADSRLIRNEVERCRKILSQMAAEAEGSRHERSEPLFPHDLVAVVLDGLPGRDRVAVDIAPTASRRRLLVPPRAISRAVRAVVENGLGASDDQGKVHLRIDVAGESWRIEVEDEGAGATPEVLARAGEPFFTTKPPGSGMGLGLFLTRAVLDRLGGRLELTSVPGQGTCAVLLLPLAQPESPATNRLIAAPIPRMEA
jgi:two-component system sensor histidine kinase RegB